MAYKILIALSISQALIALGFFASWPFVAHTQATMLASAYVAAGNFIALIAAFLVVLHMTPSPLEKFFR